MLLQNQLETNTFCSTWAELTGSIHSIWPKTVDIRELKRICKVKLGGRKSCLSPIGCVRWCSNKETRRPAGPDRAAGLGRRIKGLLVHLTPATWQLGWHPNTYWPLCGALRGLSSPAGDVFIQSDGRRWRFKSCFRIDLFSRGITGAKIAFKAPLLRNMCNPCFNSIRWKMKLIRRGELNKAVLRQSCPTQFARFIVLLLFGNWFRFRGSCGEINLGFDWRVE